MQRPAQVTHEGGGRRALAALSWVVLAASLACAALSVRGFLAERDSVSAPVAETAAPAMPGAVSAPPPRPSEPTLRSLRIVGTVRSEDGAPIPSARIEVDVDAVRSLSGPEGQYTMPLRMLDGRSPRLRFSAPGHEDVEIRVRAEAIRGIDEVAVDAMLVPVGSRARVMGTLRDERGNPIAGETVQLQGASASGRYADVTDEAGGFSMPRVRVGSGFTLVVRPRGAYADHWQRDLSVPDGGLELDVVLRPLTTRRLIGRVVDAGGSPVPDFELSVRGEDSRDRMVVVEGDASGRFTADGVPHGTLNFASLSGPYHVIRGDPNRGDGDELEIVVDSGGNRLAGRVLDADGQPVAGAQVDLAWVHVGGGLRSSSIRRSTSAADGSFRFESLGPGPHRLSVRAGVEAGSASPIQVAAGTDEIEVRLDRPQR